MAEFKINLTGGSYKHQSLPVSAQTTINLIPQQIDDPITKNRYILNSFFGQSLFATVASSTGGRGMFYHKSLLYRVVGTTLYSVSSAGVHTSLGTISGTGRCVIDALGNNVIVVADRKAWVWNGSTLTQVTDVDLQSPDSVAVLNQQAIYDGDNDQFGVSDVGDPTSINALNYATAESKADNLIRVYAFDEIVYMFGETTIEQWWNSGVGKPPFDKVQGGVINIGIAGLYAVSSNVNYVYFFGNDRRLYRLKGGVAVPVTNQPLVEEFASYSDVSDVRVWCMDINDKNYIVVCFPTANKSYVLPEDGQWFQWSSGLSGGRNVADGYVKAYEKHLVEDYSNGNIYQLLDTVFTENGSTIARQRDSAPIDSSLLGFKAGKMLTMNNLVLNIESGVGLISGQGSDPVVMMSYSDDGGKTFSTERWATIGKQGRFKWVARWDCLGSFYERIIRIRMTDPVYYCIRDCVADIEVGI